MLCNKLKYHCNIETSGLWLNKSLPFGNESIFSWNKNFFQLSCVSQNYLQKTKMPQRNNAQEKSMQSELPHLQFLSIAAVTWFPQGVLESLYGITAGEPGFTQLRYRAHQLSGTCGICLEFWSHGGRKAWGLGCKNPHSRLRKNSPHGASSLCCGNQPHRFTCSMLSFVAESTPKDGISVQNGSSHDKKRNITVPKLICGQKKKAVTFQHFWGKFCAKPCPTQPTTDSRGESIFLLGIIVWVANDQKGVLAIHVSWSHKLCSKSNLWSQLQQTRLWMSSASHRHTRFQIEKSL